MEIKSKEDQTQKKEEFVLRFKDLKEGEVFRVLDRSLTLANALKIKGGKKYYIYLSCGGHYDVNTAEVQFNTEVVIVPGYFQRLDK